MCSTCTKGFARDNKKPDCIPCPDKPPSTNQLTEYLMAFNRKATLGRDSMGGLDFSFSLKMIERETDDIQLQEILLIFVQQVEAIKQEWRNRK